MHMTNKRLLAAVLGLSCAAAVSACGSSSSSSSSGAGASPAAATGTTASASSTGRPSWCGSKKITLALADGFGDNNWRKVTTGEARNEAAQCPNVTKFIYTDGQGNTQKAISDIHSLV